MAQSVTNSMGQFPCPSVTTGQGGVTGCLVPGHFVTGSGGYQVQFATLGHQVQQAG